MRRRSDPLRPLRGLPEPRRRRRAQADRALRPVGREGDAVARRAAHPRLLREPRPRRRELLMLPFEFATAQRIVFAEGAARNLPAMGARALVVTGASGRHAPGGVRFHVDGEPTIDHIRRGIELARAESCDHVISIGGGSAIDAGKAIAALLANPGDPLDYLEVVGRGLPLQKPSVPFIAIPTTAGTGSEVTRNAVLASPEHRVKASLRSAGMHPALAVVDPELTYGLPPAVTASTGLDALAQVIEPYVSIRA